MKSNNLNRTDSFEILLYNSKNLRVPNFLKKAQFKNDDKRNFKMLEFEGGKFVTISVCCQAVIKACDITVMIQVKLLHIFLI